MNALKRILLVEDEEDVRAITEMALHTLGGYTVQACADGAEALRVCPVFDPHLILLDVILPDGDGREVLRRLRANPGFAGVPAILLTGRAATACDGPPVLGVIAKPFDPVTLHARVADLWHTKVRTF